MRHLLYLTLLSLSVSSVAQNEIRFDDEGGGWFVSDTYPQGNVENPGFIGTTTMLYFLASDSMIGGEVWSTIHQQATIDLAPAPEFRGLVRQTGDVVLFLDEEGMTDTLYDFRLQAGDSMRYVSDFYDTYLPLLAVDSIMIQNIYHKVFHFGQYVLSLEEALSDTWIEGIGSIHGPLAPRMPFTLGHNYGMPDSTRVTCYVQNDVTLWSHAGYPGCIANIILSVEEQESGANRITLHPNPGTTLQLTGQGQRPANLRLIDIQGRMVLEANAVMEQQNVDASALLAGAYVVEVTTDVGRQVLRWVKE
ncbi:MAG TPA: T9SS type A sorting domain-containing protein [Flavobacteriales bacterium]|nr:T9SS type A sorting domain-containing protein [Flavobacteriales bacterium]